MDPISAIAGAVGGLFNILDSMIDTPQKREQRQIARDQIAVERDANLVRREALETQRYLAELAAEQAQTNTRALLASLGVLTAGAVTIAVIRS